MNGLEKLIEIGHVMGTMKIAVDIREALHEKTGKGYYTFHLLDALLKQDKKNEYVLYSAEKTTLFHEYKNATVRVINAHGFKWHWKTLKDVYKEKIEVFFAPTSYIIPALHNPKKLKVVMTVHDLVAFLFPRDHKKKAVIIEWIFFRRAVKRVRKLFAVSKNTKKDVMKRFKVKKEKIKVTPNAPSDIFEKIPMEELKDFKEEKNLPDNFLLAIGTLAPRKNIAFLIRAFNHLTQNYPTLKLVIVGKKGWYFDEIFQTVKNLNLESRVIFYGYAKEDELVKLYNLAHIFVYPSLYEGFGIPPLEAMKCGCPVITSNTSSLPEVVEDAAVTIDPTKIKDLVHALRQILTNEEITQSMIEKGFAQAKKYSWEDSAAKTLEVLNSLLDEQPKST